MAAANESHPPARSWADIWLNKLQWVRQKVTGVLNIIRAPLAPPPLLPVSSPAPQLPQHSNEIIKILQERELGKTMITIAVPATGAVLISEKGQLLVGRLVVVGLMTGSMAIWNGMLFRTTFPRVASVVEQVGICFILLSLHAHVSSFLPMGFSWLLWLCGALFLLPFLWVLYVERPCKRRRSR